MTKILIAFVIGLVAGALLLDAVHSGEIERIRADAAAAKLYDKNEERAAIDQMAQQMNATLADQKASYQARLDVSTTKCNELLTAWNIATSQSARAQQLLFGRYHIVKNGR